MDRTCPYTCIRPHQTYTNDELMRGYIFSNCLSFQRKWIGDDHRSKFYQKIDVFLEENYFPWKGEENLAHFSLKPLLDPPPVVRLWTALSTNQGRAYKVFTENNGHLLQVVWNELFIFWKRESYKSSWIKFCGHNAHPPYCLYFKYKHKQTW